jgi:glycosyltransferase involved in cell wall biosynthesis
MRIGIVSWPMDGHGANTGVGNYMHNLVRELLPLATQHDVKLIHYGAAPENHLYTPCNEVIVPFIPGFAEWKARQLKLDLLHYNYIPYTRPTGLLKCKKVVTINGLEEFDFPSWSQPLRDHIAARLLWRRVAQTVDLFFAISEWNRQRLMSICGVSGEKIIVTPSGLAEVFHPGNSESTARIRNEIGARFIIHVSNWEPRKNERTLFEATRLLRDATSEPLRLLIVGRHWHGKIIDAEIERVGLEKDVVRKCSIRPEYLAELYSAADMFVSPTFYEGFGMPLAEAMGCGCPVVSTRVAAVPEVTAGAALLAQDPRDAQELAELMLRVWTNRGLAADLRERGLRRAQAFSWKECAARTLQGYEMLCANCGSSS